MVIRQQMDYIILQKQIRDIKIFRRTNKIWAEPIHLL